MTEYLLFQVMKEAEHNKGIDALLFDGIPNNLGSDTIVRPTGFIDYPNPDPPPEYKAFNYPVNNCFLKVITQSSEKIALICVAIITGF